MRYHILVLFISVFVFSALTKPGATFAGELLVIANPEVVVEQLSRSSVENIYMNKQSKWPNGDTITVVLLVKGATHKKFVSNLLGSTPYELRQVWREVIFSGQGKIPMIVKEEAKVVNRVLNVKGAIGYIDSETPHEGVKVLDVLGVQNLPQNPQ